MCFAYFDCAWRPHSLPSLPLCGKYKVSIIFPLLCYDAWWLLLIGLSWLPYMLGSCACGSNVFPGTFPKLIYCSGLLIFRAVADPRNSGISAKSREIPKKMRNTAKSARNISKYISAKHI